ncbi:nucleoid-associated protein YejK [Thalassotalea marina]|uniref:Nucleoid-associated protein n=1 Tax=Thalassotalea marina TaxID=1673741 RepID=A0A919BHE8_9GAMM|nr:nucleoid-associated protein YejK [Thalassotalea marina]GHF91845.1 nucleoid-associated protein [Thalassotalea marina]
MSLIISNIALHYVTKNQESGEVQVKFGPETIDITSRIENFVDALHNIYNAKGSKAYGHFLAEPEPVEHKNFIELMTDYLDESLNFNLFSQQATSLLKLELEKYDIEENGYLVFCHYEYMGGRYLLVTIIPVSEHYSVDGDLNISADKHLDTPKLQLAARIDLFEYQQNAQGNRYISFIKGRAGRKISDFFLDFLSCEEGLDVKEQTQTLVKAVEDYVAVNQLDANEKQEARKELLSYCKEQKESAQEVSIKELGSVLSSEGAEKDFYAFCKENDYPMEDSFPHDQAIVNKVTKYSGYGAGISISFERSHLGQDVVYNAANDSLTIYKVPPNLKDQLLKLLQDQDRQEQSSSSFE